MRRRASAGRNRLAVSCAHTSIRKSRRRKGDRRAGGAYGDVIGIQRHRTVSRQRSTGNACTVIQSDAREGENISYERSGGTESRGAADLPKHVAFLTLTAIDHAHLRVACGRERAPDLENKLRIGVALGVESQRSRQGGRRRKAIDAWPKRESTQILTCQNGIARQACESIEGSGEVALSLLRDRII